MGGKPDALTRRSGDLPKGGDDERVSHQNQVILKPRNLGPDTTTGETLTINATNEEAIGLQELLDEGYRQDPAPRKVLGALREGRRESKLLVLGDCENRGGYLWYQGKMYIPDYGPLRLRLLRDHHDSPVAGHPGRAKTLELLSRQYYWPQMYRDVDRYVRNCHTCQRSRTARHAPYGILRPLPIPERAWRDVAMDFVTGLPWSKGRNAILVVICCLTKMRHLIPCTDTITAEGLARRYIKYVAKTHGLPKTITSDRGSLFTSKFWKALCARWGIDIRLSTAFHPQTDGQTEKANAVMERYLRAYINYLQDDWAEWLPCAEFAANNHASETTGISPFFAHYHYDPRWTEEIGDGDGEAARVDEPLARDHATAFKEITEHLKAEIARAQHRQQEAANRHRTPEPIFEVGDRVWLNGRNIVTKRPSHKLDNRRHGPFEVIGKLKPNSYRLALPKTMRNHPVFHVSDLDRAAENPYPGQVIPPPPPVVVDNGEEEYFVEEILDSRLWGHGKKLKYLVKWTGYAQPDWEDAELINKAEAIDRFHQRYPHKPGPLPEDEE